VEKCGRAGQAIDDNMAHAHCILDTQDHKKRPEYVMLTAFPLPQWFHKRASLLSYMYITCHVVCFVLISEPTAIISLYNIKLTGFYNRDGMCLLRGTD